jgi:hypothetical protein
LDGSPACPRTASGPDGEGNTGPDDGGGRNGTSIAPFMPSFNSFVPAVIAASVGSDARPTRSATINTYRRVGPANPSAR